MGKKIDITISVTVKTEEELSAEEKTLLTEAKAATYRSYSPYSHFSVGAAVEMEDGTIVTGSNQENAAYPSGLCAERTAVFYAQSRYPDMKVRRLCVAARDTGGQFLVKPIPPCGACRQVLLEAENRNGAPIEIMLYGTEVTYIIESAASLLPIQFGADTMGM